MQSLGSTSRFPEAFDRRAMFQDINRPLPAIARHGLQTPSSSIQDALLRTAVIIPAQNEQESIGLVIADLPKVATVIVVDNGSTDQTASIAREAGCEVVSEPVAGYGKACLAGLAALERISEQVEIEFVAFVDGDYSDHVHRLPELLDLLVTDQADFALGSRMLGEREPGAMPAQATWGNRLACFLMKVVWQTDYTDLGPFRVIRAEALRGLEMQDVNFGWTVEMQVKASVANLRTQELPVPYRRRVGVSKISGTVSGTIRAGYKILFTIAKYAWITRLGSKSV